MPLPSRERLTTSPNTDKMTSDPQNGKATARWLFLLLSEITIFSALFKSRKSRESCSKVGKVESCLKVESRQSRESWGTLKSIKSLQCSLKSKVGKVESRLRVARVGKLLQSRRVAQVPLSYIVCTIVGVVVYVRCNHVFGLILIAKVVFAEEDA